MITINCTLQNAILIWIKHFLCTLCCNLKSGVDGIAKFGAECSGEETEERHLAALILVWHLQDIYVTKFSAYI